MVGKGAEPTMCGQGLEVSVVSGTPSHTPKHVFFMLHMHMGERERGYRGKRVKGAARALQEFLEQLGPPSKKGAHC